MTREQVLVIDDDSETQQTLRTLLESEGFAVCCASTAQEALGLLCVGKPDVILLDLGLPDLDGQFIASRLCANTEWFEIPVIVLSARSDPESKALARAFGARDYVVKPFEEDDLLDRIRQALGLTV